MAMKPDPNTARHWAGYPNISIFGPSAGGGFGTGAGWDYPQPPGDPAILSDSSVLSGAAQWEQRVQETIQALATKQDLAANQDIATAKGPGWVYRDATGKPVAIVQLAGTTEASQIVFAISNGEGVATGYAVGDGGGGYLYTDLSGDVKAHELAPTPGNYGSRGEATSPSMPRAAEGPVASDISAPSGDDLRLAQGRAPVVAVDERGFIPFEMYIRPSSREGGGPIDLPDVQPSLVTGTLPKRGDAPPNLVKSSSDTESDTDWKVDIQAQLRADEQANAMAYQSSSRSFPRDPFFDTLKFSTDFSTVPSDAVVGLASNDAKHAETLLRMFGAAPSSGAQPPNSTSAASPKTYAADQALASVLANAGQSGGGAAALVKSRGPNHANVDAVSAASPQVPYSPPSDMSGRLYDDTGADDHSQPDHWIPAPFNDIGIHTGLHDVVNPINYIPHTGVLPVDVSTQWYYGTHNLVASVINSFGYIPQLPGWAARRWGNPMDAPFLDAMAASLGVAGGWSALGFTGLESLSQEALLYQQLVKASESAFDTTRSSRVARGWLERGQGLALDARPSAKVFSGVGQRCAPAAAATVLRLLGIKLNGGREVTVERIWRWAGAPSEEAGMALKTLTEAVNEKLPGQVKWKHAEYFPFGSRSGTINDLADIAATQNDRPWLAGVSNGQDAHVLVIEKIDFAAGEVHILDPQPMGIALDQGTEYRMTFDAFFLDWDGEAVFAN